MINVLPGVFRGGCAHKFPVFHFDNFLHACHGVHVVPLPGLRRVEVDLMAVLHVFLIRTPVVYVVFVTRMFFRIMRGTWYRLVIAVSSDCYYVHYITPKKPRRAGLASHFDYSTLLGGGTSYG